jgi:hypothetical protein
MYPVVGNGPYPALRTQWQNQSDTYYLPVFRRRVRTLPFRAQERQTKIPPSPDIATNSLGFYCDLSKALSLDGNT